MSGWNRLSKGSLISVLLVILAASAATNATAHHGATGQILELVQDETGTLWWQTTEGFVLWHGHGDEDDAVATEEEAPQEEEDAQSSDPSDPDDDVAQRRAQLAAMLRDSQAHADGAARDAGVTEIVTTVGGTLIELQDKASTVQGDVETLLATLDEEPEEPTHVEPSSTAVAEEPMIATAMLIAGAATAAAASLAILWVAGSSGVAGAGGSAGAKAGLEGARRVAPVFSPLFTRFERETVMTHPNREQLYTLISANPGVRLQDLCDATNLSRTAVTHHLRLLEQQHVVVSKRIGRSRHYYENGGRFEREQKDAYAVLQNERSKEIARFIHNNPGVIQKNLCEGLGLRASIAHWHIKRLEEASLVDAVRRGRTVSYYPADAMGRVAL